MMRLKWGKLKTYVIGGEAIFFRPCFWLFPKCFQDLDSHQKSTPRCRRRHRHGVNVTPESRPYRGAGMGSREYVTAELESKVNEWISSIQWLATIVVTQLYAAFSALAHGLMNKWIDLSRTIPDIGPLMTPQDDTPCSDLLPALIGRPPSSNV